MEEAYSPATKYVHKSDHIGSLKQKSLLHIHTYFVTDNLLDFPKCK